MRATWERTAAERAGCGARLGIRGAYLKLGAVGPGACCVLGGGSIGG